MAEMQSPATKGFPSQDLIEIAEIRDDVVVLKDGTLRAAMLVSSVNFALKSENEQNGIIYAYQDFLNSLDFPIQIEIISRRVDITGYLEKIQGLRTRQQNELLRLQMDEYVNFILDLVKKANIMSKTFMVVVPFSVQESRREGLFSRLWKGIQGITSGVAPRMNDEEFSHNRTQLFQRLEQVAVGLHNIGLRVVPLRSRELLELYYTMYNPGTSRNQHLNQPEELRIQEAGGSF